jgi:hypothetical protein
MPKKTRKRFTAQEKVAILKGDRQHHARGVRLEGA